MKIGWLDMKVICFEAKFDQDTTHRVEVRVYPTRGRMHRALRTAPGRISKDTEALCWHTHEGESVNGLLSLLFFYRDGLTLNTIVHECVHAAMYRTQLMGFPKGEPLFEECVAESGGNLAETIMAYLGSRKIEIKFYLVHDHTVNFVINKTKKIYEN